MSVLKNGAAEAILYNKSSTSTKSDSILIELTKAATNDMECLTRSVLNTLEAIATEIVQNYDQNHLGIHSKFQENDRTDSVLAVEVLLRE